MYAFALSFVVDCKGKAIDECKSLEDVFSVLRVANGSRKPDVCSNADVAFAEKIQRAAAERLHPKKGGPLLLHSIRLAEEAFWNLRCNNQELGTKETSLKGV